MKHKYLVICFPIVLCILILGISLLDLIKPDVLFSEYENRILAKRPQFSLQSLFQGSFTDDYESYLTDQFVYRNQWIYLKTKTDLWLGKKEVNGVYLAQDGTLIEKHSVDDVHSDTISKRMDLLKRLQEKYPEMMVMLIPTADNILTDKLPQYAEYYDQKELLNLVQKAVGDNNVINTMDILEAHKDEYIYYGTDHHWTTLGAYYGYLAWCDKMKLTAIPNNLRVVSTEFLGTLHSKTNLNVSPDSMMEYIPEKEVSVFYDFLKTEHDSMYVASYLQTKNKYGYFLDDNHPFIEIKIKNNSAKESGKTLFMIKDSYANCFIPFLTNHYDTIYILDLRYYNGKLFPFMENYTKEKNVDVLILYNVIHFLQEFQYY